MGTTSWIEHTGGKLAWYDRLSLIAQGVRAKASTNKRLRLGTKVRYIEVEDILPPDTALTHEAAQLCRDVSEPFLFNHCMRSYFWARLIDDSSRPFDDEATFTAILLHDLGLTETYRLHGTNPQCFTQPAAQVAEKLALKHKWNDRCAQLVANAITLHLNVIVEDHHGREAQLVRIGSGGDVAGLGLDVLDREQLQSVVEKFPRFQMKQRIGEALQIEVEERPCCRASFLYRRLGFGRLIRKAPFTE